MTIAIVSPTPNTAPGLAGGFSSDWAIARNTPIVLDITATTTELVTLASQGEPDLAKRVVYRNGVFQGTWAARSARSAISGGWRLSILPADGWISRGQIGALSFSVDTTASGSNVAPIASFARAVVSNRTWAVINSSTDPDGTIVAWDWDWGDGTAHGSTATPGNHTYATDGVKTITLTVTDNLGATNALSINHTVAGWDVDATSTKGAPSTSAQWANLLAQLGIAKGGPTYLWSFQDLAFPIADNTGTNGFASASGSGTLPTFNNAKAGWSRKFVNFTYASGRYIQSALSTGGSTKLFGYVDAQGGGGSTSVAYHQAEYSITAAPATEVRWGAPTSGTFVVGSNPGTQVRPFFLSTDTTSKVGRFSNDQEKLVGKYATNASNVFIGAAINNSSFIDLGYLCMWTGADAEWTAAEERAVMVALGYAPAWTATVAADATSGRKVPTTSDDWLTVLVAAGLSRAWTPVRSWNFGITAAVVASVDTIEDQLGASALTIPAGSTGATAQSTVSGWSQKSVKTASAAAFRMVDASAPSPASTDMLLLAYLRPSFGADANPRTLMRMGANFDDDIACECTPTPNGNFQLGSGNGSGSGLPRYLGSASPGSATVRPVGLQSSITNAGTFIMTDQEKITGVAPAVAAGSGVTFGGDNISTWYPDVCDYLRAWLFTGAAANMSSTQFKAMLTALGFSPTGY